MIDYPSQLSAIAEALSVNRDPLADYLAHAEFAHLNGDSSAYGDTFASAFCDQVKAAYQSTLRYFSPTTLQKLDDRHSGLHAAVEDVLKLNSELVVYRHEEPEIEVRNLRGDRDRALAHIVGRAAIPLLRNLAKGVPLGSNTEIAHLRAMTKTQDMSQHMHSATIVELVSNALVDSIELAASRMRADIEHLLPAGIRADLPYSAGVALLNDTTVSVTVYVKSVVTYEFVWRKLFNMTLPIDKDISLRALFEDVSHEDTSPWLQLSQFLSTMEDRRSTDYQEIKACYHQCVLAEMLLNPYIPKAYCSKFAAIC